MAARYTAPASTSTGSTVAPPEGQPIITSAALPAPSPPPAGQPTGGTA